MKILTRTALGLLATLLALGAGPGAMGAASADGPDTDPAVAAAIEAQPWVTLEPGDRGYRVAAVRCFLAQHGNYDGCDPEGHNGDLFQDDMVDPLKRYQASHDIPQTGKVDDETWLAIRADAGLTGPGDGRSDQVQAVQYTMKVLQDRSLIVDGQYGSGTAAAVTAFQQRKEIDDDGLFGPITFRAAYAEGAETRGTPGR